MTGPLDPHPAVVAWRGLHPARAQPEVVTVLKQEERGTRIVRLTAADDAALIAKRCAAETAAVERSVYENVLSRAGVSAPRFYGAAPEPPGEFWWLFVAEVSGSAYRSHVRSDRIAAARWLGALQSVAARIEAARQLPDRSPGHYRRLLGSLDARLRALRSERAPGDPFAAALEENQRRCDWLGLHWSELEKLCEGGPRTLVHGDFVAHNVFVRTDESATTVTAIDWEKAGWGTPAEDLSSVDLCAYQEAVREHWPWLELEVLRRLARAGRFFRCLVFLDWVLSRLERGSCEAALRDLERCDQWLTELSEPLGW